ncbi:MAG: UDP-GlcNAc:undecaprenyl-phosphate/decaprenyl-phosphate GlcNAc-phosphate transferase [Pseudonocardiales bacterium]|nr:UDP-GlcNAc:undecaprenyl-phosphate/decaprenyl-phosphate GlcNAc-phosphate transferase [Pseudonocardiales bacterium]
MTESHPSLEYLLVACVAAAVTFLLTPVARRIAIRSKAVALPRDRDVHAVATPRMGGVALFAGFSLALFVASRLPSLHRSFENGPDMLWVVLSAAIICVVGILDDKYELDSLTKLAGQVLACGLMVTLGGVQLALIPLGDSTVSLGRDLAIPVTILLAVVTINAMNFIDGLDGLAAGVTVIAATAFFVFSYHLAQDGFTDVTASPTLLAAALAGACAGFLPHNFWPARIFMGDSGSMVVGLVLSAAATSATTSADPQAFNGALGSLPLALPLLIPLAVLALPFVDLLLAVVRRVAKGRSPFAPDKQHLHHRLLELGHSHRRAVLLLYFWSALLAFAGVGLSYDRGAWFVIATLCTLAVAGILVSVVPSIRARAGNRRSAHV